MKNNKITMNYIVRQNKYSVKTINYDIIIYWTFEVVKTIMQYKRPALG